MEAGAGSDCYLLLRPFSPAELPGTALIKEEVPSLAET